MNGIIPVEETHVTHAKWMGSDGFVPVPYRNGTNPHKPRKKTNKTHTDMTLNELIIYK